MLIAAGGSSWGTCWGSLKERSHFLGLRFHIGKTGIMTVHLLSRAYFQCCSKKYVEKHQSQQLELYGCGPERLIKCPLCSRGSGEPASVFSTSQSLRIMAGWALSYFHLPNPTSQHASKTRAILEHLTSGPHRLDLNSSCATLRK